LSFRSREPEGLLVCSLHDPGEFFDHFIGWPLRLAAPDFGVGTAGVGSVIDVTPGSVTNRRPALTRSPALGRRFFLIMRNPARSKVE
jgi:hypothetical protein